MSRTALVLGRRNVYLLPTRDGIFFAGTLLVLLLGAINYDNGLAYAFTFLLAAVAILSMATGQRNLLGLTIVEVLPRSGFSGQEVHFRVLVKNEGPAVRFGVTVELLHSAHATIDLDPGEQRLIELPFPAHRRGRVPPGTMRLSTRYPFGLLRVWSRGLRLTQAALAYPRPAAVGTLPEGRRLEATEGTVSRAPTNRGGSDFSGLAVYRVGENPRHIHWKAAASGRGLLIKCFSGQHDNEVWLKFRNDTDMESELSLLCWQILAAERQGLRYGLDLGTAIVPPDVGGRHEARCLRLLALYGNDPL
ncbi:MAG: DUF58 domain-containing protein [Acidiferrobacteraceae bacterium]